MAQRVDGWRGDDGRMYASEEEATAGERLWAGTLLGNAFHVGNKLVEVLHDPEVHQALRIIVRLLPPEAGIAVKPDEVTWYAEPKRPEHIRAERMPPPLRADEVERVLTEPSGPNARQVIGPNGRGWHDDTDEWVNGVGWCSTTYGADGRPIKLPSLDDKDLAHYGGDTDVLPTTADEVAAIDPTSGQPGPEMTVHNDMGTRLRDEYVTPTWVNDQIGGEAYGPDIEATPAEREEYVRRVHAARAELLNPRSMPSSGELPHSGEFAREHAPFSPDPMRVDHRSDYAPMSRVPDAQPGLTIDADERAAIASFSNG